MQFLSQTWLLVKKDLLLVARRSCVSTLLRALLFPIVLTLVLSYLRVWTMTGGHWGVGSPTELKSLPDALAATGENRNKFVIVDNNLDEDDVQSVIGQLSTTVRSSSKQLHVVHDSSEIGFLCPASNKGLTDCYGAVVFWSSPDHGNVWNYTLYQDSDIVGAIDVTSSDNDFQLYSLPLQHAIDSAIASTHNGSGLPDSILQFPFTYTTEALKDRDDLQTYEELVVDALGFAFFIGIIGITYHLTGYIVYQREHGMLQLVDAMMPNRRRWECLAGRVLSVHLAFDLIYAPGWIASGAIIGSVAFPNTNAGWLILIYILAGLAFTSYSVLVSSLFRRTQLSSISAAIAAVAFACVAQFAEGFTRYATLTGVLATGLLFPPCTFIYILEITAGFEANGHPLAVNKISLYNEYWSEPVTTFMGFFVFQIIAYPLIGAMIEKYMHGTSSRSRYFRTKEEMSGNAVRLSQFTKHYNKTVKKRDRVKAVEELSLDFYAGSITVLLGANGSGKSTTMNAIAGLETITSGQIEIDPTGGIGICPQKNVLWDAMTVEEHILFFERLKNPSSLREQRQETVRRLIEVCGLDLKANAKAKTLSGGQKRRLQLAMMLAGGSRVCCIDEASSGLDPLARQGVWDILLHERGSRTMLLSTHFLDEAEILSDHVAILSKGQLKMDGTVASLKNSLGKGYRVAIQSHQNPQSLPSHLPPGIQYDTGYNETVYEVPDASILVPLLAELEQSGVNDYSIHSPTIEDVFLQLAEEMKAETVESRELTTFRQKDERSSKRRTRPSTASELLPVELNVGKGCSPLKQTWIMFLKRLTVLKHNFMPYVAALFVPLTIAGLVTRFVVHPVYTNGLPCASPDSQSSYEYPFPFTQAELTESAMVFGPPHKVSIPLLRSLVPNNSYYGLNSYFGPGYVAWNQTRTVSSYSAFQSRVSNIGAAYYSTGTSGGFYIGGSNTTFAYEVASGDLESMLFTQAALDTVLSNTTIAFSLQNFASSFSPNDFSQALLTVFTAFGFAIYPGFFALYPTAERLRNVRAMQYSNGVLSSSLWLAYALFDLLFILFVSIFTVVIWSATYAGWYGLGYMFLVLLFYGMAATAMSYVVSLFVKSQLAAIACTALIQVVIAALYFIGYIVTSSDAPATQVTAWFDYIYYTVALVSPIISLFRALFMALNIWSLSCRGTEKAAYPGEMNIYGGPILYLIVQFFLLVAFLVFWESGCSLEIFGIHTRQGKLEKTDLEKDSVSRNNDEAGAVEDEKHLSTSNDGLRVSNLTRSFGSNKAVENITFGILPSEKFALLGPNGAGKSTIISLLRGELKPDHSEGSIVIANDSLTHAPVAAKNHLGVCPQFDAIDSMTLSETLHFYARVRGVPNKEKNINELIFRLDLLDHVHKLVKKLSGGTKRKLSLAIALIANPSILLLDEPSSGMDPAAKRALWTTLQGVATGRVLLITTHSMEEADALCDRAGIISGKMLALGSVEALTGRFGDRVYVHLVHRDAPYTSVEATEGLRRWVLSVFPGAEIEQRTFGGQVRFAVPKNANGEGKSGYSSENNAMTRLFRVIEQCKEEVGIADYSIGPATLNQVFLNVVGRHNVLEKDQKTSKY